MLSIISLPDITPIIKGLLFSPILRNNISGDHHPFLAALHQPKTSIRELDLPLLPQFSLMFLLLYKTMVLFDCMLLQLKLFADIPDNLVVGEWSFSFLEGIHIFLLIL